MTLPGERARGLRRLAELAYFAVEYALLALVPRDRPGRTFGLLFKWPLLQERLGLGWVSSAHVLILETTGRRSGKRRATPLGYQYDRITDTYYVTAGWAGRTDWYRNLRAEPCAHVRVGRRRFASSARFLDERESVPLLAAYLQRNPFAARMWHRFTGAPVDDPPELLRRALPEFPIVALPAAGRSREP